MAKSPAAGNGARWGIVALSLIPFVGAGGFLGSVIGRFIGMGPVGANTAVFVGSVMSGMMYAYASDAIFVALEDYPWLTVLAVVVAILCIYGAYKLAKRASSKIEEEEAAVEAETA